jgi:hypothetical protein
LPSTCFKKLEKGRLQNTVFTPEEYGIRSMSFFNERQLCWIKVKGAVAVFPFKNSSV